MHVELRGAIGGRPASVIWSEGRIEGSVDVVARSWLLLERELDRCDSPRVMAEVVAGTGALTVLSLLKAFDPSPAAEVTVAQHPR